MLKRIFKLKSWAKSAVVLPLIFVAFQTQAITCVPFVTNLQNNNVTIQLIGPTISTVGEDVAVGSIIYAQSYTPNQTNLGYNCTRTAADLPYTVPVFRKGKTLTTPMGGPTYIGTTSVYPTNVPGIGVAVLPIGTAFGVGSSSTPMPYDIRKNGDTYTTTGTSGRAEGYPQTVVVQLIKTGDILSSSEVLAATFPTMQFSHGVVSQFEQIFLTVRVAGSVKIVPGTCQVDDVNVDMGKHQLSAFSGSNSATDWKEFDITLRNCPPFYGYNSSSSNFTYAQSTGEKGGAGTITNNQLRFTFNSVYGTPDLLNSNVALLEPGADAATNLGIQLVYGTGGNVSLNGRTVVNPGGITLTNTDNATYKLPLKARYYRYSTAAVTPGKANSAVTFTVSYY